MPVYRTASEEQTIALGERLAREFPAGAVVLLIGGLGAGKTTLAKGIITGLGAAVPEEVSSPTFTLIHEYGEGPLVYHIDLYRLDRIEEIADLGLDDYLYGHGLTVIEWAEKGLEILPAGHLQVKIDYSNDNERTFKFIPHGKRYEGLLEKLASLINPVIS